MVSELEQAVQAAWPSAISPLVPAGAGDYAQAYRSGEWMVLHALHPFANACLQRVSQITPHLAPHSPVPLPQVETIGESGGRRFIVYRALLGAPLTSTAFETLDSASQESMAASLAALLRHLQRFPVVQAQAAEVPECPFPLAFEEDHLRVGIEHALYTEDLRRLQVYAAQHQVPHHFERALGKLLDQHLASRPEAPSVLLHGELSADHLLTVSGRSGLSGVIDLNGLHLGRPARDLMYLYDSYGERFVRLVLPHFPEVDFDSTLAEVRFLHSWHLLARLLWALDHRYAPGRERWGAALAHRLSKT